jgi:hypothetical protein
VSPWISIESCCMRPARSKSRLCAGRLLRPALCLERRLARRDTYSRRSDFDPLGSKEKTYASVEGATHLFQPCRREYGYTKKRVFDFVDEWVSKPGRL